MTCILVAYILKYFEKRIKGDSEKIYILSIECRSILQCDSCDLGKAFLCEHRVLWNKQICVVAIAPAFVPPFAREIAEEER